MHIARYVVLIAIAVGTLGGCSSQPMQEIKRMFQNKGDAELAAGIKKYEDGKYPDATTDFQNAINMGLSDADQVTANKYLAFISCVSARERQCRAYFTRALELNPAFELEASEAGHPVWGPVFRNVKSAFVKRKS
jgi:Tfp pilus assembly protein PilF